MLAGARYRKEEDDDPGNANLGPHFQIDRAKAGVQAGTHEIIVEEISRHAHGSASENGIEIGDERNTEAENHRNSHEMAIIVDNLGEAEYMVVMEGGSSDEGCVKADQRVTVVHERLVVE